MKNKKVNKIKECLKKGIPIATLGVAAISTTVMMSGCDDLWDSGNHTSGLMPRTEIKKDKFEIIDIFDNNIFTEANEFTDAGKKMFDIWIKNSEGKLKLIVEIEEWDEKSENIFKQRSETIKKYFAENGVDVEIYKRILSVKGMRIIGMNA